MSSIRKTVSIAAFLFDLDGTLVDTEPIWSRALLLSLNEMGCKLRQNEADDLVYGRSWLDIHADLCRTFPGKCDDRAGLEDRIDRHFQALKQDGAAIISSSVDLLLYLAERAPVAVVSGSSRKMVGEWIEELGLGPYIQFYLGCEDYPRGKPDPVCFVMAAERLGVEPASCLAFEDSTAGVEGAKSAGMSCVALERPGAMQQELTRADLVLGDLAAIDRSALLETPSVLRSM